MRHVSSYWCSSSGIWDAAIWKMLMIKISIRCTLIEGTVTEYVENACLWQNLKGCKNKKKLSVKSLACKN